MTVLKVYFKKKKPSVAQYRDYKNFSSDKFRNDLLNELITTKVETSRLDIFVITVLNVLCKNTSLKRLY